MNPPLRREGRKQPKGGNKREKKDSENKEDENLVVCHVSLFGTSTNYPY